MIKVVCVYDREVLENFYSSCSMLYVADNFSMFVGLYEEQELVGVIRLFPQENRCRIDKAILKSQSILNNTTTNILELEEFLLKSAINFSLTFNVSEIEVDSVYENYLLPMNFVKYNNAFVGQVDKIDFPSKCKGLG